MCVVSMVTDHYYDKWRDYTQPSITIYPSITQEEVDEFRRLLESARKYDKRMNQPACDLAEKKAAIKKVAEQLGVDISFIDEQ